MNECTRWSRYPNKLQEAIYYNAYYASSNGGELTPACMGRPTSLEVFIGRTRTRLDPQNNKFLVSDDDARVEQSNNT